MYSFFGLFQYWSFWGYCLDFWSRSIPAVFLQVSLLVRPNVFMVTFVIPYWGKNNDLVFCLFVCLFVCFLEIGMYCKWFARRVCFWTFECLLWILVLHCFNYKDGLMQYLWLCIATEVCELWDLFWLCCSKYCFNLF